MILVLTILFSLMMFSIMMLYRSEMIYKYHMYALSRTSFWTKKIIFEKNSDDWNICYNILNEYSYNSRLFAIFKWNYESLFSSLEERLEEVYNSAVERE